MPMWPSVSTRTAFSCQIEKGEDVAGTSLWSQFINMENESTLSRSEPRAWSWGGECSWVGQSLPAPHRACSPGHKSPTENKTCTLRDWEWEGRAGLQDEVEGGSTEHTGEDLHGETLASAATCQPDRCSVIFVATLQVSGAWGGGCVISVGPHSSSTAG